MGKVMDNVGFSTKRQDLQNAAKRELSEDEKMAIRQDLGLYGEYPQVMMSGAFTGFTKTPQGYQAKYTDLSEFPDEVQEFFYDTLPQILLAAPSKGEDFPIYEVDCDGEKRVYQIFRMTQKGQIAVYFGVNEGDMDYSIAGDGSGSIVCAMYNVGNSGLTFSTLSFGTQMPGAAHKITLTDVTPGRVNQIPSKYLPQGGGGETLVIELTQLDESEDGKSGRGTISDDDYAKMLAKIIANPGSRIVFKYADSEMEMFFFPVAILGAGDNIFLECLASFDEESIEIIFVTKAVQPT